MIEVKNLDQSYTRGGHKRSLTNVSLTLKERAVTALVGANGAGKSTLLGVMSNLIAPMSGSVTLDGTALNRMKAHEIAKKIAILKQTQQLGVRLTVGDLVEFGRFPHCMGRPGDVDREKIAQALDYMNLADLKERYLDELSGGQRQRAFIAMILAQDTPYVFLDEPLNNLDIKYSVEMMKIIQKLVSDLHKTVVVVLHDINFAAAYAGHIVAMKGGRIICEGDPETIITKEVLDGVFDHPFHIEKYGGKNVCLYFD